jgi:hypothetical protein
MASDMIGAESQSLTPTISQHMNSKHKRISQLYNLERLDEDRGSAKRIKEAACKFKKKAIKASFYLSFLFEHIPILSWLPKYRITKDLSTDLISGFTVGVMNLPQGFKVPHFLFLP